MSHYTIWRYHHLISAIQTNLDGWASDNCILQFSVSIPDSTILTYCGSGINTESSQSPPTWDNRQLWWSHLPVCHLLNKDGDKVTLGWADFDNTRAEWFLVGATAPLASIVHIWCDVWKATCPIFDLMYGTSMHALYPDQITDEIETNVSLATSMYGHELTLRGQSLLYVHMTIC